MTQDEIIEMARQAGFDFNQMSNNLYTVRGNYAQLEAFAKLVADKATEEANANKNASWTLMCKKMVAFEREACAKVAFSWNHEITDKVAEEIRARGEQA